MDVNFHRIALDFLLPAIEPVFNLRLGADRSWRLHQCREDGELAARQTDRLSAYICRHGRGLQDNVPHDEPGACPSLRPPGDRTNASRQFGKIERLAEIIVGTGVEAPDAILD